MWQNRPTSTTPVSILICAMICNEVISTLRHHNVDNVGSSAMGGCTTRLGTNGIGLLHILAFKRRIDDEVSVIRYNRPS